MFKKAKKNKKGFTLAELLIVVAIIAVLVAISIPIFSTQLEKSRDAVTVSNLRAAYAEASAEYLTSSSAGDGASIDKTIDCKGKADDLSGLETELPFSVDDTLAGELGDGDGDIKVTFTFDTNGNVTVAKK